MRNLFDCTGNRAADKADPLELRAIVPFGRRSFDAESALFSHLVIFGYPRGRILVWFGVCVHAGISFEMHSVGLVVAARTAEGLDLYRAGSAA